MGATSRTARARGSIAAAFGAIYEVEILASESGADVALLGERGRYAPFGVRGGHGEAALNTLPRGKQRRWHDRNAADDLQDHRHPASAKGQRLRLESPGGGGWGEPATAERRPPVLPRCPRSGFLDASITARETYRVAIHADGTLDANATAALREGVARLKPASTALVGVDVGGTFTDLAYFEEASKTFRIAKVPSNRGDEAIGFIEGLKAFGSLASLGAIIHGTTVGTNALLERKGARIGIITTPGFRDVLEMRRRDRPNTWGLWGDFTPVVPRELRLEVPERTLADGSVRLAVDPEAVRAACRALLAEGATALAIVFINAYANPANEHAAYAAACSVWPNEHVVHSAQLLPEFREFERTSTVALNAYLQPVVASYLGRLNEALEAEAFSGSFHIVQSNGGIMSTAQARKFPVRTALSGPAAGVIAAAAIAGAAGYPDIVTADLGGTSFDVSLVAGGKASLAAQTTIDFGMVVRTPMIEITTIGAGGRLDRAGRCRRHAGGRPGKRGIAARSGCLWAGQYASDPYRRQYCSRADQRRAPHWWQAQVARCRGRARRDF